LGAINDFGTIDLTGATSVSTINMEGNGADSVVDFSATNSATALTSFGTGDIITSAMAPSRRGWCLVQLYRTTLTVTETSASGTSLGSAIVTVSGVTGAALSSASFIALYGRMAWMSSWRAARRRRISPLPAPPAPALRPR